MKRVISLICLFLSLTLIASCTSTKIHNTESLTEKYYENDITETEYIVETKDTAQAQTDTTYENYLDKYFYEFLDALVAGETDKLIHFGGVRSPEAYAFWKGTDVVGYKILNSQPCERIGRETTFTVELDISSSTHELFPVGKSQWSMTTLYSESGFLDAIRPANIEYKDINMVTFSRDSYSAAVNFCYYFSVELDKYLNLLPNGRTCGNFNQIVPDIVRKNNLYKSYTDEEKEIATVFSTMMWRFIQKASNDNNSETYMDVEWMTKRAYDILGIDTADFTRSSGYNEDTGKLSEHFLGGYWKFSTLESEETDSNGNTIVILDWYADTLLLVKACTLKYTLKPIEDSFRLLSVEELFNTGYELAYGST